MVKGVVNRTSARRKYYATIRILVVALLGLKKMLIILWRPRPFEASAD